MIITATVAFTQLDCWCLSVSAGHASFLLLSADGLVFFLSAQVTRRTRATSAQRSAACSCSTSRPINQDQKEGKKKIIANHQHHDDGSPSRPNDGHIYTTTTVDTNKHMHRSTQQHQPPLFPSLNEQGATALPSKKCFVFPINRVPTLPAVLSLSLSNNKDDGLTIVIVVGVVISLLLLLLFTRLHLPAWSQA